MREVICRECEIEFNPDAPNQKDRAFYNLCIDCQEEQGIQNAKKVKAVVNTTEEGDFDGISVMSAEDFEKYKELYEESSTMAGYHD